MLSLDPSQQRFTISDNITSMRELRERAEQQVKLQQASMMRKNSTLDPELEGRQSSLQPPKGSTSNELEQSEGKPEKFRTRRGKHHFFPNQERYIEEIEKLKAENHKLRTDRIEERRELRDVKSKNVFLQESLDEEKQRHEEIQDAARAKYREAEVALIAQLETGQHQNLPDDNIQNKLAVMFEQCKEWINEWHRRDIPADISKAWAHVNEHCTDASDHTNADLLKVHIQSKGQSGIKLLCECIVMRDILLTCFCNPFYHFRIMGGDSSAAKTLRSIYEELKAADSQEAYSWRAKVIIGFHKLLHTEHASDTDRKLVDSLFELSKRDAKKLVNRMSELGILMAFDDRERRNSIRQLAKIRKEMALLSLEIFSRELGVRVTSPSDLYGSAFAIKSLEYVSHNSMGLDKENHAFDGQPIQMVITPSLKGLGKAGNDGSQQEIIWSRAVVLILKDEPVDGTDQQSSSESTEGNKKLSAKRKTSEAGADSTSKRQKTADLSDESVETTSMKNEFPDQEKCEFEDENERSDPGSAATGDQNEEGKAGTGDLSEQLSQVKGQSEKQKEEETESERKGETSTAETKGSDPEVPIVIND